jgi:2'-5' RNA ligase
MELQIHRLFFALLPDATTRALIAAAADAARAAHGFRGAGVEVSRYHMTLQFLGDFPAAPRVEIDRAKTAAASLRNEPLEFALDRITSFGRGRFPCVLRTSAATEPALRMFWQRLYFALIRAGFSNKLERNFAPHVTLGYGDTPLAREQSLTSIVWRADEFVLLESLVGRSIYNEIERWPLHA